jgi:hypothetical protein
LLEKADRVYKQLIANKPTLEVSDLQHLSAVLLPHPAISVVHPQLAIFHGKEMNSLPVKFTYDQTVPKCIHKHHLITKNTNYLNLFLKETIRLLYRSVDRAPANDESCLQEQQCYSLYSWETLNICMFYPGGTVSSYPMG